MLIILAIVGLLYTGMLSSYATQVNLAPSNVAYFSNGDSLTLMCTVDQDVHISSVLFRRDTQAYVEIVDAALSTCWPSRYIQSDTSSYSVTCDQQRNFTLIKKGNNAENHRKNWQCILLSNAGGLCRGGNNPCVSPAVVAILQVPVTTVQMLNGSDQTLSSSVNIVRGQNTGIRCSTAPNGSRPRALFQWYYGQGNQSPVLIVDQSISLTPDPIKVPEQPEPDLLISYSTWTLTGNASYHNMYVFCEARDETNTGNYTQSSRVQINIVYSPAVHLISNLYAYNVTEGMQHVVFACNIIEANPLPQANSYSWFHSTSMIQGQTSSSYTLPSVQRTDAGEYMCSARNVYGTGTSNSLVLNVQYAPDVRVNISGSALVGSTAVLMCVPQGNPPQYTFHPWIHMVGQTEIRRLSGVNTVDLSTLSLSNIGIQHMGRYICTVDNYITGLDGQIHQMGDSHVKVQGYPVLDKIQTTFAGEPFKSASIQIPFYSHTSIKMPNVIKQLDSSVVSNTSDISIYILPSNITMMFYMKKVMIPGHVAVLYFRNVTETDFGNYTLQLTNDKGTVSTQFDFIASVPPSLPKTFFFSHIEGAFLVFGIEKGFNGGHEQAFIVEYQTSGMPDATWSTISKINENDLDNPFSNGTYYIKIPKLQDGHFVFRVYAENKKGNSSAIEGVYAEIKTELPSTVIGDYQVGAVVGGVVGAVVLVIAIVVVAFVVKRWTLKPKMEENMLMEALGNNGPEYVNTAFRSDINTTEYEALQSDQTGANQYETLNDLNSTDGRILPDPGPSSGVMFYNQVPLYETNQVHMYINEDMLTVDGKTELIL